MRLSAAVVPLLALSAALAEDPAEMGVYLPGGALTIVVAVLLVTVADRSRGKGSRPRTAALVGLAVILLLSILLFSITGPEHIRNIPVH